MRKMLQALKARLNRTLFLDKNIFFSFNRTNQYFKCYCYTGQKERRRKAVEVQTCKKFFGKIDFPQVQNNNNSSKYSMHENLEKEKISEREHINSDEELNIYAKKILAIQNIAEDHIDGTLEVDIYFSENLNSPRITQIAELIEALMIMNYSKDVKNLLNKIVSIPDLKWNGVLIDAFLKGVSYLKYDCDLPANEYMIGLKVLKNEIERIPTDFFKREYNNIINCIYYNELSSINEIEDSQKLTSLFYWTYVKEALCQELLSSMEESIRNKFKRNIWDNHKLFKYVVSKNSDGVEFILKSALHLDRHLEKKEKNLLILIMYALKGRSKLFKDTVDNNGVTSSGYNLSQNNQKITRMDTEKLIEAFEQSIECELDLHRHGLDGKVFKRYFQDFQFLKKKFLPKSTDKYYAVVIDGLNMLHLLRNHEDLCKIMQELKKSFTNVVFVTQPIQSNEFFKFLRKNNIIFLITPRKCNDDIFTIITALKMGEDTYILSNDLYRDFQTLILKNKNDKLIFKNWSENRRIRMSIDFDKILLPKPYELKIQGNFKNLRSPFEIFFPCIYYGAGRASISVEEWYCLKSI